jgi:hypothetical protein
VSSGKLSVQARFFISATRASRLQEHGNERNQTLGWSRGAPTAFAPGFAASPPGGDPRNSHAPAHETALRNACIPDPVLGNSQNYKKRSVAVGA